MTRSVTSRTAPHNRLLDLAAKIPGQCVVVIGDIMLDRFIYGDATRISPESPVPVLNIKNETMMLGGAGNVLSNLHGLNVTTHLIAVTGTDQEAETVRALVEKKGADAQLLVTDASRPTTVKTRYLAAHQQLLRTDYETNQDVDDKIAAQILKHADKALEKAGALILSDYGKGTLTASVIKTLIKKAHKAKIPVLVDPKKEDYGLYKGSDIVTPNRDELKKATFGMPAKSDDEVITAATHLLKQSGIRGIIATRSQDGMTVLGRDPASGKNLSPVHLRTEAVEVFDVSGAGDTVIATAAAALAAGATLTEAGALANSAGGLVVAKVGTTPIRHKELLDRLEEKTWLESSDSTKNGEGKSSANLIDRTRKAFFCTWDEAEETVLGWKRRGLKVGLTNGCFDILHSGHVSYLNEARSRCDRLIIGLNADESVRRLKGPARPVNDESARATVIGGLGAVDMVVVFGATKEEKDMPINLIKKLKPDIFFKGGDYTEAQLPEAAVVKSYGGEVALMDLVEGRSTTKIIEKARA